METKQALLTLAALSQETRLAIHRLLVSFHLAGLARAGLAQSRDEGRFVIYSADFQAMNSLVGYLTENCCQGGACETTSRARRSARPRAKRPQAEVSTMPQKGASCCYAKSDKYWTLDPQGIAWESFHTLDSVPLYGEDTRPKAGPAKTACCGPER